MFLIWKALASPNPSFQVRHPAPATAPATRLVHGDARRLERLGGQLLVLVADQVRRRREPPWRRSGRSPMAGCSSRSGQVETLPCVWAGWTWCAGKSSSTRSRSWTSCRGHRANKDPEDSGGSCFLEPCCFFMCPHVVQIRLNSEKSQALDMVNTANTGHGYVAHEWIGSSNKHILGSWLIQTPINNY